jgi:hypothetical protein
MEILMAVVGEFVVVPEKNVGEDFWLEQNSTKQSKWAKLAREGHDVAWEFAGRGGSYTGRMLVDGEVSTPSEATKSSCKPANNNSPS